MVVDNEGDIHQNNWIIFSTSLSLPTDSPAPVIPHSVSSLHFPYIRFELLSLLLTKTTLRRTSEIFAKIILYHIGVYVSFIRIRVFTKDDQR